MTDTVFILPPALAPGGTAQVAETPFGAVSGRGNIFVRTEGSDARALIYAAKAGGARRVIAADFVQPVSPLLEPGDIIIPADLIDQTKLRPFTFFVGKGYGFIKLNPPFCPDLMGALLGAARRRTARSFRGGTYVCADGPRDATPAELRMYRQWGADLVGTGLLPEVYLARELELCYGAITAVGEADLLPILQEAVTPVEQTCACGQTMKLTKEMGAVGEDWRTWL
ncbi:MAG: methylthioadenosine phosphorylase [Symbiobacteriaceae bacterium]|jgi:5'-methylthioadenosine phosphorylase|nr:methylthioadenosine phosphorylase [Symbiobacteriaceae bacterium]